MTGLGKIAFAAGYARRNISFRLALSTDRLLAKFQSSNAGLSLPGQKHSRQNAPLSSKGRAFSSATARIQGGKEMEQEPEISITLLTALVNGIF